MHEAYFGCSIKIVKWTSVGEGESERGKILHDVEYSFNSEERKVGGVYYTPKHIVDHIIDQTVRMRMRIGAISSRNGRIRAGSCGGLVYVMHNRQRCNWLMVVGDKRVGRLRSGFPIV